MVSLRIEAIMPQNGLSGNIALALSDPFSANKRRTLVQSPDFVIWRHWRRFEYRMVTFKEAFVEPL